jgi:integrase/recombinase XerD
MKLMDHNPLDAVKLPKVSTLSPTIAFDDEEVTRMMSCPDISTKTGNTHRLIIVLLFYLGTRRSELVNIRCKDIFEDRGHRVLRIVGKGKKERNIPLADFVIEEINSYKKRFSSLSGEQIEDEDFLIQTRPKGKNTVPADGSTIFRIVTDYARKLGINKHVGPHSCRATVISHLLDTQHKSIRDVAIFAGHSNITTTERYDKKRKGLDDNPAYSVDFEGPKKSSSG